MIGEIYDDYLNPNNGVLQVVNHIYQNIEKQIMQTVKITGNFDGIDNKQYTVVIGEQ